MNRCPLFPATIPSGLSRKEPERPLRPRGWKLPFAAELQPYLLVDGYLQQPIVVIAVRTRMSQPEPPYIERMTLTLRILVVVRATVAPVFAA